MGVDIGIGDASSAIPLPHEPALTLEDDGYYWFLHPLFEELRSATGQYIDLYGDASFSGESLHSLGEILQRSRAVVESQPDSWEVCIGKTLVPWNKETHSRPRLKKVFSTVERGHFLDLLDRWDRIVARAAELKKPVVCFGD